MVEGKGKESKKLYHALRLLREAERIIDSHEPLVYLEGAAREELLNLRLEKTTKEEIMPVIQKLQEKVSQRISPLPKMADSDVLSSWLVPIKVEALLKVPVIAFKKANIHQNKLDHPLYQKSKEMLYCHGITKAELLYLAPTGSHLFGLAEDSDIKDYVGVFVLPTEQTLNDLKEFPEVLHDTSISSELQNKDKFKKGLTLLEVTYACNSILKSSDIFFGESLASHSTEHWKLEVWSELEKKLSVMKTQSRVLSYLGQASGFLARLSKYKDTSEPLIAKFSYLAQRYIIQAEKLISGHAADNQLTDEQKECLIKLKKGDFDIKEVTNSLQKKISDLKGQTKILPKDDDIYKEEINNWLLRLYKALLNY
eukprot:TRINITY_DN3047_c0_g1_i1.p1 TRINITY_DN3047_c0_g1~~TRINITY_DN3047_c0_g1_i1.p1  ORF type:complete len:368 (+),score=59.54 TRINITY_DN3047_c0_g1_i1:479-1582(+)